MNVLLSFHKFPESFPIINNNWMPGIHIQLYQKKKKKKKKSNLNPLKTYTIITSSDLFYTKPVKKLNTLH